MLATLQPSDWIALISGIASLVVGLAALVVAFYAVYRGNRNTSVATAAALNVAFRDAWDRYLHDRDETRKEFHFAELMNLFEIGCATCEEKSLAGVSRNLIAEYMREALGALTKNPYAVEQVPRLLTGKDTFLHIKRFMDVQQRKHGFEIPDGWSELLIQARPERPSARRSKE